MVEGIRLVGDGARGDSVDARRLDPHRRRARGLPVRGRHGGDRAMARSFKEAQTLLTPVYFLCFTPSLIAGLGDWDLTSAAALVPGRQRHAARARSHPRKATVGAAFLVVASTLAFARSPSTSRAPLRLESACWR